MYVLICVCVYLLRSILADWVVTCGQFLSTTKTTASDQQRHHHPHSYSLLVTVCLSFSLSLCQQNSMRSFFFWQQLIVLLLAAQLSSHMKLLWLLLLPFWHLNFGSSLHANIADLEQVQAAQALCHPVHCCCCCCRRRQAATTKKPWPWPTSKISVYLTHTQIHTLADLYIFSCIP